MLNILSSSAGTYASGSLLPGDYTVTVTARGFKAAALAVTAQVGVVTNGDVKLEVGMTTTTVTVEAGPAQISTSQATVQTIVTPRQIEQLPFNGRNFLNLAALEPGVQIQDGGNFDPTKNGFSSVSFGGRFGRTARIEVDGIDVSDETVGTTTQNIPASGIQEFQVEQSTLDPSTELTSSGAINVTTKAGSNAYHGEGYFFGRWHNTDAKFSPGKDLFFRRAQFGTNLGGAIWKDRIFFFLDWEHTRQDLLAPVTLSPPFTALAGGFNSPFRERELLGRLDFQIKPNWHAFFRTSYDENRNVSGFVPNSYQTFANVDNTPVYVAGTDFTTGNWSHSIRFGFTHFANAIADSVTGSGITNLAPEIALAIGGSTSCLAAGADNFCSGPNILAPQATLQHNTQVKYDGYKIQGTHIFRFGFGVNRIQGGGFAKFFGIAPAVRASFNSSTRNFANTQGPFPGGDTNPLNYPVRVAIFGNGQGFFTEIPKFGFPAGGQFDTRLSWYFADAWKVKPNLTLTGAVRYVRDTGRSDADLPPIPELNMFGPGLGNSVQQPNKNFAPTLGIAWRPLGSTKTVIRAGAGLNYENAVFNNVLFDRPGRLKTGLFFGTAVPCPTGVISLPDGTSIDTSSLCGKPIGVVAPQLAALQKQFQAATIAAGPQANGSFVGNTLAQGANSTGNNALGPDYRTPFSWQFNAGVQRQMTHGTVLSVDYVRNVGLHFLLGYDTNHLGDARFLNKTAAENAIDATNAGFGCPAGTAGIGCAIAAGAGIVDYANNGLDSGTTFLSAFPASAFGLTPDTGAAFPGINPNLGENQMLFPIGRSVYNALQVSLRSNVDHPAPGVRHMFLSVNYALSRFTSEAQDQDFINLAIDQRDFFRFRGPNGLDRTHQLSVSGVFDLPLFFRLGLTSTFDSRFPGTLTLPATGEAGEIFRTDVTGDGTTGDVLPGTNVGSFGRGVNTVSELNSKITAYNSSQGGGLTPAGQALVAAGLFTADQLKALGAVAPLVDQAPARQVTNDSFINTDARLSWVFKPKTRLETLTIEPSVGVFNLFNVANYRDLGGELNGGAGFVNGTTQGDRTNLITNGSGVFSFGSPRAIEWGVRITF